MGGYGKSQLGGGTGPSRRGGYGNVGGFMGTLSYGPQQLAMTPLRVGLVSLTGFRTPYGGVTYPKKYLDALTMFGAHIFRGGAFWRLDRDIKGFVLFLLHVHTTSGPMDYLYTQAVARQDPPLYRHLDSDSGPPSSTITWRVFNFLLHGHTK